MKNWLVKKLLKVQPSKQAEWGLRIFTLLAVVDFLALMLLPLLVFVVLYLLTLGLGVVAFALLVNMLKAVENPFAAAQEMLSGSGVDFNDLITHINTVFGDKSGS